MLAPFTPDRPQALAALKSYRKKWKQKVRGFIEQILQTNRGPIDQNALLMVEELDQMIGLVESGVVACGYYTSVIVLLEKDTDRLEHLCRLVSRVVCDLGFSCRLENLNALEAWLGSLPSNGQANIRRPMMHTLNLADLLPMTTAWSGEPFNPSPLLPPQSPPLFQAFTHGRTAFRGNVHVNDLGNFLILGPPGAGKSTLLAFLNAQVCRYPKARVFAFDKGYSLLALCLGVDGHHYDIGEDQNLTLCPLSRIAESKAEQTWAETWIASLCEYQNFAILPHHRQAIHQAMTTLSHAHSKTLTDFVATLQDIDLRQVLKHYTLDGAMGALLDGESDNLEMKRFQVFEIGTLMELGDKNALPVLEYLFHRIETTLDGSLAMLSIDEAWMALQHPVFREKIREWLKVFRKANVAVGLATQSISDAASSGILDVLMEACPTKIFLANPSATTEASSKFYRQLGLSDKQINIIANLIPKRDYYFTQPTGKRVINLGLGPQSLCWLGVSSKDDVRALKTLKSTNSDWRQKWVASR